MMQVYSNTSPVPNLQLRQHLPSETILSTKRLILKLRGLRNTRNNIFFWNSQVLRYPANVFMGSSIILKNYCTLCPCNVKSIISIGDRTTIGDYTYIYSSEKIIIGKDCMIAPFCYVVDSNHGMVPGTPFNLQPNTTNPVAIGDNVWIGTHSLILPGVEIGNNSIIASGSVVTKSVASGVVVGGNPAKIIKELS